MDYSFSLVSLVRILLQPSHDSVATPPHMSKTHCHPRTHPLPDAASLNQPQSRPDAETDQNDLVRLIAWQIFSRVPRHASVEVNDVIQAGHLGLLRARRSYRTECDVPFPIYARYRIRGEILDMLRRLDSAPRSLRRWQKAVDLQTRDLTSRLQRLPTDEELSDTLGIEIGKVRRNRQMLALTSREHDSPVRIDEDFPSRTRESIAAADWMPDVIHERKESFEWLLRSIEKLAPRPRQVVLLYYRQNLTMKQIGSLLQVNESRVSQIHKTAIQTMSAMVQPSRLRRSVAEKVNS
jgi:RNA polymerase sigma factor for flagellar operon FliA